MQKLAVYLKWIGTCVLIIGTFINAFGIYPLGVILLTIGGLFWLAVAIIWRDNALIVTNLIMSIVAILGLIFNHII